ncbi:Drug resistance protein [Teratosphaeria destructans]|uniref:Drug resistance protein n=1 Tax=Teratosphaeria destructans TaxID=418781 RepID=A0A9W7W497_9PEZI|nr:Drug resistance protein [Teratosphaeria destructans]
MAILEDRPAGRKQDSTTLSATSEATLRTGAATWRGSETPSRSLQNIPDDAELETPSAPARKVARSVSDGRKRLRKNRPDRVASGTGRQPRSPTDAADQHVKGGSHGALRRNPVQRHPPLRDEPISQSADTEDVDVSVQTARSDALRALESRQPFHDLPSTRSIGQAYSTDEMPPPLPPIAAEMGMGRAWSASPVDTSPTQSCIVVPKPRISLKRLSSLDNIMTYREEVAAWKRASSVGEQQQPEHPRSESDLESTRTRDSEAGDTNPADLVDPEREAIDLAPDPPGTAIARPPAPEPPSTVASSASSQHEPCPHEAPFPFKTGPALEPQTQFRHPVTEMGFTFAIAMSQLLGEFLISGFALELSKLAAAETYDVGGTLGLFWPASLLSLILSATLLVFARLSDMYGGYPWFMFGLIWLTIWTLLPAFAPTVLVLDVSRAMQGLSIAAFTPSTFVMVGTVYEEGPRKNFVMGLYSGCAPLGFFAGFLTAGALRTEQAHWWFWIVAAASALTAVVAWLCVPHDRTNRKQAGLQMDWAGACLITAGLILVAYALAVSTYDTSSDIAATPMFYVPLTVGVVCLLVAVWVEGWWAKTPLLPFDFFKPKSVKAFCLAGLFFYASYGVWLYTTTDFFESTSGTVGEPGAPGIGGITLAIWYTPTAVGGVIMCVLTGALLHIVPPQVLLVVSGFAWIGASLIFAVCPYPVRYWSMVLPSMICATLGLDLTYTVSLVYLSSVQPTNDKDCAGPHGAGRVHGEARWVFRSAFIYAAASAGVGFIISVLFVRISSQGHPAEVVDEEQGAVDGPEQSRVGSPFRSEVTTLVDAHDGPDDTVTRVNSAELERR